MLIKSDQVTGNQLDQLRSLLEESHGGAVGHVTGSHRPMRIVSAIPIKGKEGPERFLVDLSVENNHQPVRADTLLKALEIMGVRTYVQITQPALEVP